MDIGPSIARFHDQRCTQSQIHMIEMRLTCTFPDQRDTSVGPVCLLEPSYRDCSNSHAQSQEN